MARQKKTRKPKTEEQEQAQEQQELEDLKRRIEDMKAGYSTSLLA